MQSTINSSHWLWKSLACAGKSDSEIGLVNDSTMMFEDQQLIILVTERPCTEKLSNKRIYFLPILSIWNVTISQNCDLGDVAGLKTKTSSTPSASIFYFNILPYGIIASFVFIDSCVRPRCLQNVMPTTYYLLINSSFVTYILWGWRLPSTGARQNLNWCKWTIYFEGKLWTYVTEN